MRVFYSMMTFVKCSLISWWPRFHLLLPVLSQRSTLETMILHQLVTFFSRLKALKKVKRKYKLQFQMHLLHQPRVSQFRLQLCQSLLAIKLLQHLQVISISKFVLVKFCPLQLSDIWPRRKASISVWCQAQARGAESQRQTFLNTSRQEGKPKLLHNRHK